MNHWQTTTQARIRFASEAESKLVEANALLDKLQASPWETGCLNSIARICHRLAGTGGFFGLNSFAQTASDCEGAALDMIKLTTDIPTRGANPVLAAAEQLRRKLADLKDLLNESKEVERPEEESTPDRLPRVLFVCSDPRLLLEISDALAGKQLDVAGFRTCSGASDFLKSQAADSLVVVAPVADGPPWQLIESYRNKFENGSIFQLTKQNDFMDKVLAIKLGIDAIFEAPFDMEQIANRLSCVEFEKTQKGYRVLSVEDDPIQAEIICSTLQAAGYAVMSIPEPSSFEEALISFAPDLLLLDVDLGGNISGFDLARYVRRSERFATIPIVFLTTRNQLSSFITGITSGADDYLIKPISTQYLIAGIAARIERHRLMQRQIERDGLTGTYTYSNFLMRCQRHMERYPNSAYATMAIFDIDGLSRINSLSGLAVGDRAIATVGKLLKETFRQTDLVGRTNGGEFSVMTDQLDAKELSEVCHYCLSKIKSVEGFFPPLSVSVGLVSVAAAVELEHAVNKARATCKAAKKAGGSCVIRV